MRGAAGGTFEETCRARGVALTVGVYRSVSKIVSPRPSRNGRWLVPSQQQYLATRQGENGLMEASQAGVVKTGWESSAARPPSHCEYVLIHS